MIYILALDRHRRRRPLGYAPQRDRFPFWEGHE
jgi:hypothetical protein